MHFLMYYLFFIIIIVIIIIIIIIIVSINEWQCLNISFLCSISPTIHGWQFHQRYVYYIIEVLLDYGKMCSNKRIFVCLFVCLFIYSFIYLSIYLFILFACLDLSYILAIFCVSWVVKAFKLKSLI